MGLLGLTALLAFRALTALLLAMGIGMLVAALAVMLLVSHAEIPGSSSIPLAIARFRTRDSRRHRP